MLHQLWFWEPVAMLQSAGSAVLAGSRGGRTRGEKPPQMPFRLRANEPASPPRNRRKKRFILTNSESLQRGWPFLSKLVYHTEAYMPERGGEGTGSQVIYASLRGKGSATRNSQAAKDTCPPTWDPGGRQARRALAGHRRSSSTRRAASERQGLNAALRHAPRHLSA